MGECYVHLNLCQRIYIQSQLESGLKETAIAAALNRQPSTIGPSYNETGGGVQHGAAQRKWWGQAESENCLSALPNSVAARFQFICSTTHRRP